MKILRKLLGTSDVQAVSSQVNEKKSEETGNDVSVIAASLLFDEAWYRKTYGFGKYLDAASHYLYTGWKEGKDPSPFFSTNKYLEQYPDVRTAGMNPLLHFEHYGYGEGRWAKELKLSEKAIREANPDCCADMQDGFLRVRITNACNAKCRYCGVRNSFGTEREHAMDPVWYYEYCKLLYDRVRMVLITGGDAFVAAESYNYMKFLSEKYPKITVMTESNGIAFHQNFRELAAQNLFKTHFSINASNATVFGQGCWEGNGGEAIFPKLMENIQSYVGLLKEQDKLCFAPSVSMVINKDNAGDVLEFIRMGLRLHAWYICFFFDYTENDMNADFFGEPETSRKDLRILMEVERLLAGKVLLYFRLWLPAKEAGKLQQEVEAMPIAELEAKYPDLLELSEGRSVQEEFEQRNAWRKRLGKHQLELDEDYSPSVRLEKRNGQDVCFAPWKELDLYPNGRMDFCGWFAPTLDLHSFVRDGRVNWDAALNSFEYMSARKRMLQNDFRGCQLCCPMNSCKNPVTPVHKYGYDRIRQME